MHCSYKKIVRSFSAIPSRMSCSVFFKYALIVISCIQSYTYIYIYFWMCCAYRIHSPVEHIQSMCLEIGNVFVSKSKESDMNFMCMRILWEDLYHSGQWKTTKTKWAYHFHLNVFVSPKSQKLVNCTNHLADFPHTNSHFPYSTHILLIHTQTPCVLMIRMYVEECSYIRFILYELFLFFSSFFYFVHFGFVSLSFVNGWLVGWL